MFIDCVVILNYEHGLQVIRGGNSIDKRLGERVVNDGGPGAGIFQIVLIIIGRQQRIDHRDHRSDARRGEPRPGKFRTIRQHDQYPILHLDAQRAQRIGYAIRHPRRFAIGVSLIFEVEADFVFPPFLQIVIEEVLGHVEVFREFDGHRKCLSLRKGTATLIVFRTEVCARFPKFGKEFFVERRAQITNSL